MIATLFDWLGQSGPGRFLAASTPAFATVQAIHLIGLAGLGGGALVTNLIVLRAVLRGGSAVQAARALFPLFLGSLLVMTVSGVLLVSAGPDKYLFNPLFPIKFVALGAALALQMVLYPGLLRTDPPSVPARVAALLAIIAWVVTAIIGRWVGLI